MFVVAVRALVAQPVAIEDISAGSLGSAPSSFVALENDVFFVADDGILGTELWRTDGTLGGATMVADIRMGSTGSNPEDLHAEWRLGLFLRR